MAAAQSPMSHITAAERAAAVQCSKPAPKRSLSFSAGLTKVIHSSSAQRHILCPCAPGMRWHNSDVGLLEHGNHLIRPVPLCSCTVLATP